MKLLRIAILIIILLTIGGFYLFTSDNEAQDVVLSLINDQGSSYIWIVIIIFGLTLISTATGLPVFYFSVGLGFMLKLPMALTLAWIINLVSVMATFYMVKSLYYPYFRKKYGKRRIIQSINRRIKKYGFWTIAISRSIYIIPTNIINFSFPLSKITMRQYFLGTAIGLVPESLINVLTGYLLKHQIELLTSPGRDLIDVAILGAAFLLIIVLIIFFYYRRKRSAHSMINEIVPRLDEE